MKAAAIILSGGKSRRMGTNKALLKINGKTNIERMAENLKLVFDDCILVTNEPELYASLRLKMVSDHYPGKGPLAGIHAGLTASDFEVNFVVACDMPFASVELAKSLVDECRDYDAVVPVINGKQQPLFSVFKKNIGNKVEQLINLGSLRMKDLLVDLNVLYITEKELNDRHHDLERAFFNMNHPIEYEEAKKMAGQEWL